MRLYRTRKACDRPQLLNPPADKENGLLKKELNLEDDGILSIIRQYTREAGVRNLEREIGSICRKIVTQISEGKKHKGKLSIKGVHELLGRPKFMGNEEIERRTSIPGVATGLAWTPSGGDILFIEASRMPGSKGFEVTGSVGTIMQEISSRRINLCSVACQRNGYRSAILST